jgi:hypothetical protein
LIEQLPEALAEDIPPLAPSGFFAGVSRCRIDSEYFFA